MSGANRCGSAWQPRRRLRSRPLDLPGDKGLLYVADASDNTVKVYDPAVDLEDPFR